MPAQATPGQAGVGSLYRYSTALNVLQPDGTPSDPRQLFITFQNALGNNPLPISNRVCDGVIHFRFRAFNTNGLVINSGPIATTDIRYGGSKDPPGIDPTEVWYYRFWSNAVPAFVEMEFGLLEPRTLARYNAIPDPNAALTYLTRDDNSTRVHLFRQRIPIRNVDPSAFQ